MNYIVIEEQFLLFLSLVSTLCGFIAGIIIERYLKASRGEKDSALSKRVPSVVGHTPVEKPRNPESLRLEEEFLDCGIARVMNDVEKEKKKVR